MTKIFYGNQYVESFKCDGDTINQEGGKVADVTVLSQIKRATKGSIIVSGAICVGAWLFVLGGYFLPPKVIYADKEVIKEVKAISPVMKRIADCESGKRDKHGRGVPNTANHYNQYGQVLIKPVMTGEYAGTYDIGYYQINSNHNATAKKLGYNLAVEADNKAYGEYLYENVGTQPWYSSRTCWQ